MTVTPKDNHVPCSESPCCSPKGLEPHISHSMALTSSSQDSAPSLLAPPPQRPNLPPCSVLPANEAGLLTCPHWGGSVSRCGCWFLGCYGADPYRVCGGAKKLNRNADCIPSCASQTPWTQS